LPEWEARLTETGLAELRVETTLLIGRESFRVRANRGAIDVTRSTGANKLSISVQELVHLATGYLHLDEVFQRKRRLINADARSLLAAIFPKRNPYVHLLDRF